MVRKFLLLSLNYWRPKLLKVKIRAINKLCTRWCKILYSINKYPDLIIKKGIGIFSYGEIKFESQFDLIHYPEITIINALTEFNFNPVELIETNSWELNGEIDHGIQISTQNLHLNKINDKIFTYRPFKEIKIGEMNLPAASSGVSC